MIGKSKPQPAAAACDCAERLAALEETVAALARAAVRSGDAKDVIEIPGRPVLNHHDAALIRAAAAPTRPTPTDPNQERA